MKDNIAGILNMLFKKSMREEVKAPKAILKKVRIREKFIGMAEMVERRNHTYYLTNFVPCGKFCKVIDICHLQGMANAFKSKKDYVYSFSIQTGKNALTL